MTKKKWTYEFRAAAIADTGDYEDWVQFTNGKDVLQSSEDISDEDAQQFCELLNAMPDLWSHRQEECKIDLHLLTLELQDKIEAAVLAERKRVWDVLDVLFKKYKENGWPQEAFAIDEAVCTLLPSGEPTAEESSVDQTNPPAGERRDDE